jgi:hypothetical protein
MRHPDGSVEVVDVLGPAEVRIVTRRDPHWRDDFFRRAVPPGAARRERTAGKGKSKPGPSWRGLSPWLDRADPPSDAFPPTVVIPIDGWALEARLESLGEEWRAVGQVADVLVTVEARGLLPAAVSLVTVTAG